MDREELKEIIKNHQHFLEQDVDNWESMRADLKEKDLSSTIITWKNLREADLRWAYLTNANLADTNLSGANLVEARLEGANLNYAYLRDANLQYAHLEGAILTGANLQMANLFEANLTNANLDSAILINAILSEEDEIRKGVILSKSIIGWKKCEGRVIVKLKIPKGAVVFSINGKKCRTNKCKVISIDSIGNDNTAVSMYDNNFTYTVGKVIEIDNFDLSYNVECGSGIHFFLSEEDARNY